MKRLVLVALVCALTTPVVANAAVDFGIRGGLTLDPDQIHVGGHADFGLIADRIGFRPNLEVGFGDNLVILAINFEAAYRFVTRWDAWAPYAGGGIGINRVDFDDDRLSGGSSTETGLLILGGIEKGLNNGGRLFLEAKVGFSNAPDLKLTIGTTLGR